MDEIVTTAMYMYGFRPGLRLPEKRPFLVCDEFNKLHLGDQLVESGVLTPFFTPNEGKMQSLVPLKVEIAFQLHKKRYELAA